MLLLKRDGVTAELPYVHNVQEKVAEFINLNDSHEYQRESHHFADAFHATRRMSHAHVCSLLTQCSLGLQAYGTSSVIRELRTCVVLHASGDEILIAQLKLRTWL